MARLTFVLCLLSLSLVARAAAAKGKGLKALTAPSKVVYDGLPNEFDTDWRVLTHEAKGSAEEGDLAARATVAYDAKGFHIAADVTDDKLVGGADHVELLLGIPGGTLVAFRLFPGVAGKSRAQVKDKSGRKIAGAKIVEAPKSGGYTLEAFVPWKAVPKSSTIRVGYRGGLFVHDADGSSRVETVLGSTDGRAYGSLPPISTMPELALGSGLLRKRNIQSAPKQNLMANVVGDKLLERVLVYDRFLVVLGPGYRDGEQFYYRDLGTADVKRFELRDYTGDGKADVLLEKRVTGSEGTVDVLEVLSYHDGGETPAAAFAQEVRLVLDAGGRIENSVRVSGTGSRTTIRLAPGTSRGIDKARFSHASSTGASPVLVPWGTIKSQTFAVAAGAFKLSDEQQQRGDASAAQTTPDAPARASRPRPRGTAKVKKSRADPERVYALYKRQRKIKGKARFDLRANLVGSNTSERLVVHGRDLVVFGAEFRGGRGFSAITLSHFESASDIQSVASRDITGDGRQEIVVQGLIHSPLPEDVGSGKMHRTVMLVYKVKGDVLERVFAAELARRIGKKRVEAKVSFSKKAKRKITLQPGKAVGYTKDTYPWLQKTEPDGDFEPLLLPWGGVEHVRLKYDGARFVR